MNFTNWPDQYEFPTIEANDLQDFPREEFPPKFQLANSVLSIAASSGLPMSRFEVDYEDDLVNLAWREPQFDLFVHTSDDGEVFGYYRQRSVDSQEINNNGSDLNSLFDVRVCIELIGMNFMPTLFEFSSHSDLNLAS